MSIPHPLHAVSELAKARNSLPHKLIVEHGGALVRLRTACGLWVMRGTEDGSMYDRWSFDDGLKSVKLTEDQIAADPQAILDHLLAVSSHPFRAVATLAASRGMSRLELVVERGGAYVRLHYRQPDLLFKSAADPGDSIDRISFAYSDRIDLDATTMAQDPAGILQTIRAHIETAAPARNRAGTRAPDDPFRLGQ